MSWWKSPKTFPVRIFLIALILRIIPVVAMRTMGIGLDDMFQYDMLARSLAAGDGYRWYAQEDLPVVLPYLHLDLPSEDYDPRGILTSFRPPLYPAFLALIYLIFGTGIQRFFIARLVQAFMAATLAPLTYWVTLSVFPGGSGDPDTHVSLRPARIAAWIVALYPMLVIYPLSLATENLFFVLILAATLVLLKAKALLGVASIPHWRKALLFGVAGVLLGMACLTRSVVQVFTLLAAGWVWFFLKQRRMALIVLAAAGITVLPWIIRNSVLYGRLTGIETALGYDLYVGYHPAGTGTFQYPQSLDLMTMSDDSQRDSVGLENAWGFIKADPARFSYLVFRRAGYFFGLERRALTYFYSNNFFGHIPAPWLGLAAAILCLPYVLISLFAVFGLSTTKWHLEVVLFVLFFIGYITPHLFIIAEDRFHLTTVPFLASLAAVSWTGGLQSIKNRWRSRAGKIMLLAAVFIALLLVGNWSLELFRDADKLTLLFGARGNLTYFSY